ncbi:MAG TPA: hypothetical protein VGC79_14085 [Polyangiaceae bacterium]
MGESAGTDSYGGRAGDPAGGGGTTSNAGAMSVAGTNSGSGGHPSGFGGVAGKGGTGGGGTSSAGTSGTGVGGTGVGGTGIGGTGIGGTGIGGTGIGGTGIDGTGTGGTGSLANGCASLTVPLTAITDQAHFVITLAGTVNFSGATISVRVYAKAGVGGSISSYVQDSAYKLLRNSTPTALNTLLGWQTLTWNVGTQGPGSTGIALASVSRIGIEISASPDAAWSSPTLVYVDSIAVSSPTLSYSFDTSSSVRSTPSTLDVAGQVLWQNSNSVDTTASNVTLGWITSCP